ncbi:MAG: restriction endonuclease S subunit [Planctomycetota bacterium]|jgi:restriction endonuclease S subunit
MKQGWEDKKLMEIADVSTGKYDANHANDHGIYRFYTCAYNHVMCNTNRFSGESLILPGNGVNVGEVFYYDGEFDAYQRTYIINKIKIFPRYLHYHMLLYWKELGTKLQYGSATNFIKIGNFQNYDVSYPPLYEQQSIVAILDTAFVAIAKAKANAEQNLKNAKELFESYLQGVFENKGDGWEENMLGELADEKCTLSYGIVQPGDEYTDGIPVIRPTDLKSKFICVDGLKRIDPKLADGYKRTKLIGDELLLCVRGSTGIVSIALKELEGANVTRGIVPIRFNTKLVNQDFGYYLLISNYIQKQIRAKTYGAALMQINIGDLRKILTPYPSIKEQQIIVQKLDALSLETKKLEAIYQQKINDLEELKKSVLQKAFAGELKTKKAVAV